LRELQDFQAKHQDVVVLALSVDDNRKSIEKVLAGKKLDSLRVAISGTGSREKFGLSEAIPATVVVVGNRIRVVHEGVLPDPVAWLEADLAAVRKEKSPQAAN
jgi:3-keto-L-gulonate-6-phosphate decarboxylase